MPELTNTRVKCSRCRAKIFIFSYFTCLKVPELNLYISTNRKELMVSRFINLPRKFKILVMLVCDALLLPLAFWSAIALRHGTLNPDVESYVWLFLFVPVATLPIFTRLGLYRSVVRFADEKIVYKVIYGVSLSVLILTFIIALARIITVPRSSILIFWVMGIGYILLSRFLARGFLRRLEGRPLRKRRVAIYGAGQAGMQTARALAMGPEFEPVIFFDDNPDLHGTEVVGIRVFNPQDAMEVLEAKGCDQVLLAIPSASRERRKAIIQFFEGTHVALKTLPGIGELVDGRVRLEDIRDVGVEDLLGRDPVPPFPELISKCIRNRVVLVTGAGGSIGSELCRQIAMNGPQVLVLFEQGEYFLYKIEQYLNKNFPSVTVHAVLGDVTNQSQLERVFKHYKVQTIYHAAAYKHVPLVEGNVTSGVYNNVFGTLSAARASIQANVENFVLISTDKAVRPTNVMGASKRLSEIVLQACAKQFHGKTCFTMVRFGNVLGSSGSVVPLFKEQIQLGGPVTVTHPEVTRYFMTIPEAAQLVLQAGAMGVGGDVFVLDMGEPVKIVDLAKKVIELSGFSVKDPVTQTGDIAIEFIGLRPGEKLYEELLIGSNVEKTSHPRIMRAVEGMIDWSELEPQLNSLRHHCELGDSAAVVKVLRELVREYQVGLSQ